MGALMKWQIVPARWIQLSLDTSRLGVHLDVHYQLLMYWKYYRKGGYFFFFFGFVFKAHENKVNLLSCEQENRMGHKIDMYPF